MQLHTKLAKGQEDSASWPPLPKCTSEPHLPVLWLPYDRATMLCCWVSRLTALPSLGMVSCARLPTVHTAS